MLVPMIASFRSCHSAHAGEASEGWSAAQPRLTDPAESQETESDAILELRTFAVRKLDLPRERETRRAQGKRSSTRSQTKRGRYVRSRVAEKVTDVAFDATVRAAAPHQLRRRQSAPAHPRALQLESQDLRQKVRERKTGNLIVFVVDASASMDAEQRMMATRGAIISLLRHAYVRRDKVALVAFSGRSARIVLRPTAVDDLGFTVTEEDDVFVVRGAKPERWILQTDFGNEEAVGYLADRLARLGVEEALGEAGATAGAEVVIGDGPDAVVFDWDPDIPAGSQHGFGPRGTDRRLSP